MPLQGRPAVRSSVFAEFPVICTILQAGPLQNCFLKNSIKYLSGRTHEFLCVLPLLQLLEGVCCKNTVCNRPVSFVYRRPSMESTGRDRTTVSAGVWRPALSAMVCIMGTFVLPFWPKWPPAPSPFGAECPGSGRPPGRPASGCGGGSSRGPGQAGGGHDLIAAPPVGQGKNQFKICFRHGRLTPLHRFSIHPLAEPAGGPGVDAGQGHSKENPLAGLSHKQAVPEFPAGGGGIRGAGDQAQGQGPAGFANAQNLEDLAGSGAGGRSRQGVKAP